MLDQKGALRLPYLVLRVTCGCQIWIMPVREFHRCILYPCSSSLLQGNLALLFRDLYLFSLSALIHYPQSPYSCGLGLDFHQCSNCFGRFAKSQRLVPGNLSRPTKDSRGADKGEVVPINKPLETSSSNEMENNGSNSRQQRSSSSVTANHRISETRAPPENDANSPYVNHALRLWTERRREWVGGTRERPRPAEHTEPVISWSTTYEDLLGTSRPFTQPIPLPEMVDFLVDVWEQEGLYE